MNWISKMTIVGLIFFISLMFFIPWPVFSLLFYFLFVVLLFVYVRPIYGIYLLIPVIPLRNINLVSDLTLRTHDERYPISILLVILIYGLSTVHRVAGKEGNSSYNKMTILLFFIVIWAFITLFWTIDIYHGVNTLLGLVTGVFVLSLFQTNIKNRVDVKKIFYCIVFASFFWATLTFISKCYYDGSILEINISRNVLLEFEITKAGNRPGGFAGPHFSGSVLSMSLFIIMAVFLDSKGIIKFLLTLLGLFVIMNIFLTGSKGPVIGLILGLYFTILINPTMRKRVTSWFFFVSVTLILVYLFNIAVFHEKRLTSTSKISKISVTSRIEYWKAGFEMMSNRWIGAGAGGFAKVVDPVPHAHSFYFSILFDLGIIGLLLFSIFILWRIIEMIKTMAVSHDKFLQSALYCLTGALVAYFINGIVDMEYTDIHFWMFLGIIGALVNVIKRQQLNPNLSNEN